MVPPRVAAALLAAAAAAIIHALMRPDPRGRMTVRRLQRLLAAGRPGPAEAGGVLAQATAARGAGAATATRTLWAVPLAAGLLFIGVSPWFLPVIGAGWVLWEQNRARSAHMQRRERLAEQLEAAVPIIVGRLRAGQSLPQAIAALARRDPPLGPVAEEVLRQHRAGVPVAEAWMRAAAAVSASEMRRLGRILRLEPELGPGFPMILSGWLQALRAGRRQRRETTAQMAEARLSALVLVSVSLLLAVLTLALDPEGVALLLGTGTGRLGLVYALASWAAGVAVCRRLARGLDLNPGDGWG